MHRNSTDSECVRVFAAVAVDASAALAGILRALGGFGNKVRSTKLDQLHVTLKFFGDADAATVSKLCNGMDAIARRTSEFDWQVRSIGAFPSTSRPSFVWAGTENASPLFALAAALSELGALNGFERECRAFRPHVTLARIRDRPPREIQRLFEEFADEEFGVQHTSQIVLYRSILEPQGPVYDSLHVAPLRSSNHETVL